jgi:hypothetical protein
MIQRSVVLPAILVFVSLTSGCAMMAPTYSPALENVQRLKDSGTAGVKLGAFTAQAGPLNPATLSLRGNTLVSPQGESFALYLAEALKQELALAGKLKQDSAIEVAGVLLKNDISIGSFVTGRGEIEARFTVKRQNTVVFDKPVAAQTQWESSFAGAIAIPRGQQEYPRLVQTLIRNLLADADFIAAIK